MQQRIILKSGHFTPETGSLVQLVVCKYLPLLGAHYKFSSIAILYACLSALENGFVVVVRIVQLSIMYCYRIVDIIYSVVLYNGLGMAKV